MINKDILLFIPCPFCGSHAAKILSNRNTRSLVKIENTKFSEYTKVRRYYTRCMVCNARGPLAKSENLAREFWNNSKYDNITKNQIFESLRYQK